MMERIKQLLTGDWRSYKLFSFLGNVEIHTATNYIEFSVNDNHVLSVTNFQTKREAVTLREGQWSIEAFKECFFIWFFKTRVYEIITAESQDLVLADVARGSKIFFAKMPEWKNRIEIAGNSVRRICADKKALNRQ